jgi:hypothetical protein
VTENMMKINLDDEMVKLVKTLIGEGVFDDAILDRMQSHNPLIDKFCNACERVCREDFRCKA